MRSPVCRPVGLLTVFAPQNSLTFPGPPPTAAHAMPQLATQKLPK